MKASIWKKPAVRLLILCLVLFIVYLKIPKPMPFVLGVTGDFTALSMSCAYGAVDTVFISDEENRLPVEDLQTILDSTYLLHIGSNILKSPVIYYSEEEPLYYLYPHHLNETETSWVGYSFSMQGNHIYIDNITYVIIGENKIAPLIAPYCEEAREE